MRVVHRLGDGVAAALLVGWTVVLALILRHRVAVSHDTLINYAHVWYISSRIWHGHGVPFRMPVLGHGRAFAFPYGLVPWLTAALFRPLAGDWIVTLWLVLGTVGLGAATFAAFPELRRSWWAVAILIDPALIAAALIGQLPFIWGAALLLGAVACWRRGRRGWATVLAALAQVTHPAVVAPMAALLVAGRLPWEPDRRALLRHYAISLVPVVPAALIVWRSPVFVESSVWVRVANFFSTLLPRSLIVAVPVLLTIVARRRVPVWVAPALVAALVIANVEMWSPLGMPYAWGSLHREPDQTVVDFTRSSAFVPGRTYRLLRIDDGKVSLYQLLRAGGRLDSEFFPESILRLSWPTEAAYSTMLRARRVDDVMIWPSYARVFQVNEYDLLTRMARSPVTNCSGPRVCVDLVARGRQWRLYRITRTGQRPTAPASA